MSRIRLWWMELRGWTNCEVCGDLVSPDESCGKATSETTMFPDGSSFMWRQWIPCSTEFPRGVEPVPGMHDCGDLDEPDAKGPGASFSLTPHNGPGGMRPDG